VYSSNPHILEELQVNTQRTVDGLPNENLKCVR